MISLIAPASAAPMTLLNQGLDWVEKNNFSIDLPQDLLKPRLFFASSLENQLKHIKAALYQDHPFLWCLRGGYGSARLIPYLKKIPRPKKEKILIGFSDITALHLFFNQQWGWKSIHGRVFSQMNPLQNCPDYQDYKKIFLGLYQGRVFKGLKPLNLAAQKLSSIQAQLTGGNLRILETSIGTDWQLKTDGKIVFLEDVGERGYSLHRMLMHLEQAKVFTKKTRALVLGTFTEGLEKDGSDQKFLALKDFAKNSSIPVFYGLPAGHGAKNYPLPFKTSCEIKKNKNSFELHTTWP
jgi:muramoyltetrapeptide carboxypeptidase